jgi:signal transduction histidine kinase
VPLSIKTKQVAGVTLIVALSVALLTGWYLSSLAYVRLEEANRRVRLLVDAIYQGAQAVVASRADYIEGLKTDSGLRSILEASAYDDYIVYAAIVDRDGQIVAGTLGPTEQPLPPAGDLEALLNAGTVQQVRTVYAQGGQMLEQRRPLFLQTADGSTEIGAIRVGLSTLLLKGRSPTLFKTYLYTAGSVIIGTILIATVFAQLLLRPIHVIRSGLARLGRGELDVNVDLPKDEEFGDLGESFKAVSARLAQDRTELAGQKATLESVVEHLEDAVALFAPDGRLLFANPAMRAALGAGQGSISTLLAPQHPYRIAVEDTLAGRGSEDPQVIDVPDGGQRLVLARTVDDAAERPMGVMLVVRNLAYLSQVESTISYSRKLAALGRLSAGVAHEIKNPLNATMIHLELLKMQLANQPAALDHVGVIAAQVRRLDEVVQGFLKFTRPEDLQLRPVLLSTLLDGVLPVIRAEGGKYGIDVRVDYPPDLPAVNADAGLLEQAFLNLGINACQAMPNGGRLRISAGSKPGRRIEVRFEDTGVGISAEQLPRIFDLYYTTKPQGSGIGLSLVYRTIQLHDGEVSVESVPGRGTTFRLLLRQAAEADADLVTPASASAAS